MTKTCRKKKAEACAQEESMLATAVNTPEAHCLETTEIETDHCHNHYCKNPAKYEVVYIDDDAEEMVALICLSCWKKKPKTFTGYTITKCNKLSDSSSDDETESPSLQAYQDLPTGTIASLITGSDMQSTLAVTQARTYPCEALHCSSNLPASYIITYQEDEAPEASDYLCEECKEIFETSPAIEAVRLPLALN